MDVTLEHLQMQLSMYVTPPAELIVLPVCFPGCFRAPHDTFVFGPPTPPLTDSAGIQTCSSHAGGIRPLIPEAQQNV